MRRHWQGLTVFVEHPHVPMDNNAAERANRPLAVARKNFYGSGLMCTLFSRHFRNPLSTPQLPSTMGRVSSIRMFALST
jgi:Transposase IS66 family